MSENDDQNNQEDNVVQFAPRPKKAEPSIHRVPQHPPMLNIPQTTKMLAGLFLGVHFFLFAISTLGLYPNAMQMADYFGGFIPGSWTGVVPFFWWTPLTPLTSMILHGSWMHIGVNLLMMVAIGSGVEKWLGRKRYLILFFLSGLIALITHLAVSPFSDMPVVGASGAISGLFGAILLGMRSGDAPATPLGPNMMPVILVYIGISVLMGLMGAPDGSNVAWVAHIGGFLGGIGITHMMLKRTS